MKKDEVIAHLKEIIIDRLDVEESQIVPEASFVEDLGADSLDIVELIMVSSSLSSANLGTMRSITANTV